MQSVVVNIDSKKEFEFFLEFIRKMGFKSKILSAQEKEDIALLKIMEQRKDEENFPIKTTFDILEKKLSKNK